MKVKLKCVDCGAEKTYSAPTFRSVKDFARADGGAVGRENQYYCPNCAPLRRNVGAGGGKRTTPRTSVQWLPKGFTQLSLDDIKQG